VALAARSFYIVDAFSDRPFGGNPAVVVPDAAGLSDAAMRAIAAELRMEAGFVLPPTEGGDLRIRFFSPGGELDLSGHVTIAAYAALAAAGRLPSTSTVRQESRAGVLEVRLEIEGGPAPWVTLDVGRPRFGVSLERREVAEALRVGDGALAPGLSPRVVTCGVPIGVAGMADPGALQAAQPDMARLAALSRRRGVLGMALFAQPGLHPKSAVTARFFFPAVGPDEDVVSGAAVAAICAYGVRERLLAVVGETTFQTDQGHALGRPNRALVTVATEGGQLANLRVRGRGAVSAQGTFVPPE
jgi:trans-2,3-dihydro-3-hydroxyanthranilate isomerase